MNDIETSASYWLHSQTRVLARGAHPKAALVE